MPLSSKGAEIKSAMTKEYGEKKGEEVFYASKNAGTITGVDIARDCSKITAEDCGCTDVEPGQTLAGLNARNRDVHK